MAPRRRLRRNWLTGKLNRSVESRRQETPPALLRKEQAACCLARRDSDGRLPIGWCSAGCERRSAAKASDGR